MSSMESFYGGRQGSSFIIVKRFDGVNIPENSEYRYKWFAQDTNGLFYVPLIEKNTETFTLYSHWGTIPCDGVTTVTSASGRVSDPLPIEYQEGMIQCFSKGGATTSIVNYGEYVIIDSLKKEDPDNGKIYRRGMNYDYSPVTNPLAGGEYIGQIVGPKGTTPEIELDHYDDIASTYEHTACLRTYTVTDGDIVPGSWEDGETRKYKDNIDYVYATMIDELGNTVGCIIGFKITTLVMDFEASSITPYTNRKVDPETGKYYNDNLITEDPDEYVDGKWVHPFFEKWQIKIPQGYHGVNSTDIEVIPSMTMPIGFKDGYEGANLYLDAACTEPYMESDEQVKITTPTEILRDADYNADPSIVSAKIKYNDQTLYVKKEDCYMDILRYRETNFDNKETGEVVYYEIGKYDTIERVTISDEGVLTVYYRGRRDPQPLDNVNLRWIDTIDSDGVTVDAQGTITIFYNTKHTDPITGERVHDKQVYPNVIKWIDHIEIEVADSSGMEGTGDQRVHVTYNVPSPDDPTKKLVEAIDNPLNYIIETSISRPTVEYPNVPYWHLLVYYSDPALRNKLRDKWVTYPSVKYPGVIRTQWVDLGSVKGENTGIHVLKNVTDMSQLKDGSGNWIPPEQIETAGGVILNGDAAGWSCTLQEPGSEITVYLFYDYDTKQWYRGSSSDPSAIDPSYVIDKSKPNALLEPNPVDVENLKTKGFWFAVEKAIAIK